MSVLCPVLVGRATELDVLTRALTLAGSGQGGVVVLSGDAGLGKSRLLMTVTSRAVVEGALVLTGRALPESSATPYRPLAEALLDVVLPGEMSSTPWATPLAGLLPGSLAVPSTETTPLVRGEALLRLLRTLARDRPVVLALEDLHWADTDTMSVLDHLAGRLDGTSVLVVATLRTGDPEAAAAASVVSRLGARRDATVLELGHLAPSEVEDMVRACIPDADQALIDRIAGLADGVPFLVEELLGSPDDVPRSLTEAVARRLDSLDDQSRSVVYAGALLDGFADPRLIAAVTTLDQASVAQATDAALDAGLVELGPAGPQWRHALVREAVQQVAPAALRVRLARAALDALAEADQPWDGTRVEVGAELALAVGDRDRASALLTGAGREASERGALGTAATTLSRAVALAVDTTTRRAAQQLLVEVLALAGRYDECLDEGRALLASPGAAPHERVAAHLSLAMACVEAARWTVATTHLAAARALLDEAPDQGLVTRCVVLEAEGALAERDLQRCAKLIDTVLREDGLDADVHCHAIAIRGRSLRAHDLKGAETAFEELLTCAVRADRPLWQLKALHELGTVELFEHAGVARLEQACRTAEDVGALSTLAVLHLQLTAARLFRFENQRATAHALAARDTARELDMRIVVATASVFLAEAAAALGDLVSMEEHLADAERAAPGEVELEASAWAARGLAALLHGDWVDAWPGLERAFELLINLPNAGPGIYLGLWPLLLAADGDSEAERALARAQASGITVNRANRGMLGYAEAMHRGSPDPAAARALAEQATVDLLPFPVWGDLARLACAERARDDGWGDGSAWLGAAANVFDQHQLPQLTARARQAFQPPDHSADRLGITPREREVLRLLATGLSNREIAAELVLSTRTVEKHVESLLRKTGTRTRTQLATSPSGRQVAYRST